MRVVEEMAQALDARQSTISGNRLYLDGQQPLAFMSAAARSATRLSRMVTNIPRAQVNSIAERLRVTALTCETDAEGLWDAYARADLDQRLPVAFREALGLGSSYAIAWDPTGQKRPRVTVESPVHVIAQSDPLSGQVSRAFKRWTAAGVSHGVLYEPDVVRRYVAESENATLGWRELPATSNPLGVVPVVEFRNSDWLTGEGVSDIEDLKPLVDALNKVLADLMVGSEYYARPRRFATGVEMGSDDEGNPVNPFPEGDRMMIAEQVEARFGSLPPADLQSYEAAVKILTGQIMAVSALPAHYLGSLTGQVPGADGLRATEAALAARAEGKQAQFGRPIEALGRIMQAIRLGGEPDSYRVGVRWASAATRSTSQEADAVVKYYESGLYPAEYALAKMGHDAGEISEILAARRRETVSSFKLQVPARTGGAPEAVSGEYPVG